MEDYSREAKKKGFAFIMPDNLYALGWQILTDPDLSALVRRAYTQGVVLDTWMHGDWQAEIVPAAQNQLAQEAEVLAAQIRREPIAGPVYPFSFPYLTHLFQAVLTSMALFRVHTQSQVKCVSPQAVTQARDTLNHFAAQEPWGLRAVLRVFHVIWSFEDLNALCYFRRLPRAEFLSGISHRPWVQELLADQLSLYLRMGLVKEWLAGQGEMLRLTPRGQEVLRELARILEESGELAWRANQQRWDIFRILDYDAVFHRVGPDSDQTAQAFLNFRPRVSGMQVLEVGAGTGRVCVDMGLYQQVLPGGQVLALEPSPAMIARLQDKCTQHHITNVQVIRGHAEQLPLPDRQFDQTLAVAVLHFTDVEQAVQDMVRVTKPGGWVGALLPPPEIDVREIPMVALWLRPLSELAEEWGLPFSDRNGLAPGRLEAAFRQSGLEAITLWPVPMTVTVEDPQAFFALGVKGAAIFQHVLARLPYRERGHLLHQLEQRGKELVTQTQPEEQRHIYYGEAIWGQVPQDP